MVGGKAKECQAVEEEGVILNLVYEEEWVMVVEVVEVKAEVDSKTATYLASKAGLN